MKGLFSILTTLALVAGSAHARTIGVNFDSGSHAVQATDAPGLVAGANWNNVSGSSGSGIVLRDDAAAATAASLSFSAGFSYAGFGVPATANSGTNTMYRAGIGGANAAAEASVTVTNIPYAVYDVYVYASADSTAISELSVTDGTTTYYYASAGAANGGAGSLLQTTSTSSGSPTVGPAQYQVFSALAAPSFTLTQAGSVGGVLSNNLFGLHIVEVLTPGPTMAVAPATSVTANSATLHGEVIDIGGDAPSVTFYFGDETGGRDPGAWDTPLDLPGTHTGVFAHGVSGLSPATTYYFGVRGTNSEGSRWALETESFTTLPLAPAVGNVAASDIQAFSATVGATVAATGGEDPAVMIYYGTIDAGTDPGAWQANIALVVTGTGGTANLSGLAQGTTYYFRAFADNSGGEAWASQSASFTTRVATPASVVNRIAADITGSTARLRGTVTDAGNDPPSLTFFFGTTDGGTSESTWERSVSAGTDNGNFSKMVSLLVPQTGYFFRTRAVNRSGTTWAPTSESFTTTAPTLLGVVINEVHHDAEPNTEAAEFVELLNAGDLPVDLSGWRLEGVGNYIFPGGTSLAAGQFLVVAEDPVTMLWKFGVTTTHQYAGGLDNDGDDLRLVNAAGTEIDRVDYQAGFPWPTAARGTGASMELIHPALDNDLGGSWRSSGTGAVGPVGPPVTYLPAGSIWSYRKGTSEASTPVDAWRGSTFVEDDSWLSGDAVIGYGDGDDVTMLGDMQNGYSSVYLRKTFLVPAGQIPARLLVRVYVDDGAIVWINGTEVGRRSVNPGEKAHDDLAIDHERAWEEILVNNPGNILVGGTNVIAVHALNGSLGSSDFSIDVEIKTPDPGATVAQPTPGGPNSVMAATASDAPPTIRQVSHQPEQPTGGQEVAIIAKVTDPDDVGAVTLSYQAVDPGSYTRKTDAAYDTGWTDLPMADDGTGGDIWAADGMFTVTIPAALQVHRRLVRYRITVEDALGNRVRVPYDDDESPNFAYFVHDGVPAWMGAKQPGSTSPQTIPAPVMANSQPVYHLIANATDVSNSQYSPGSDGVRMWGTMVYDGIVYDHIQFYNRGEYSTYVSGKNKWRFKFNRARGFKARDLHGRRYTTTWKTMNFNACASPWLDVNRGMAGIDEAVPHRLHQLAGVPSSNTHWVQFRVVDAADEAPADQYAGDLWGLYLAIEHLDGRFLAGHGLPDGNVYKVGGVGGNKKHQGPTQTEDSSDWSSFAGASANLNSVSWWRTNFHLDGYYSFKTITRATGDVDLGEISNYYMYHHTDDRWRVLPWDLDMMYAPVVHAAPGIIRADKCLDHPEIRTEFRNRCRGLADLLFSDIDRHGGHAAQLVEELSQTVNPSGVPLTLVDADEFMWSYHPRTTGGHRGPWYLLSKLETSLANNYTRTIPTSDHEGFQQNMIDYMHDTDTDGFTVGDGDEDGYGFNYLSLEAADPAIPDRPAITYSGDAGFPADGLRFISSAFSDPQGSGTFASMQWRIGEISNPGTPGFVVGEPWVYEVEDRWDSGQLTPFAAEAVIPVSAVRPGNTYRARVRHWDASGRASHWSEPIEFVAGSPDVTFYQDSLVISEIMYHPTAGSQLEFIELHNVGAFPVDLTGVRFTKGIDFDFPDGTMLEAGGFLLVVNDLAAFEAEYGADFPVAGEWELGDKLSNGGEVVKLSLGAGTAIHEFLYGDKLPWPTAPDGGGFSLTLSCLQSGIDHADPANWRPSVAPGGSPGTHDGQSLSDWLAENGLGVGDELTDKDSDGLPALIEFVTGSNPNDSGSAAYPGGGFQVLLVDGVVAEYLVIEFTRRKGADGVSVAAEVSTDLVNWIPAGPVVAFSPSAVPDIEVVTIRAPDPLAAVSGGRQFIRLVVTAK